MIWAIAAKEIRENFRTLKFRIVGMASLCVIIFSNILLMHDYERRTEDYFLNQPKAGEARVVIRPSFISIYATGLQKTMARGYDIRPGTLLMLPSASLANVDLVSSRFAIPDIAYVVRVLLSLLAMLIAFDTISAEKQHGTLRLLLSTAIPRTHVVLGKMLGNYVTILMPFTIGILTGLLLVTILGGAAVTADELVRLLLFVLGSALFLAIFMLIAIAISAHTRLPSTSLIASLFAWSILVFAVPNISGTIARTLAPLPSAEGLEEEKLLTYHLEGMMSAAHGTTDMKTLRDRVLQLEQTYRNVLARYVETTRMFSFLSPASSFLFLASGLCQNGLDDEIHLKKSVIEYRNALLEYPSRIGDIQFNYTPRGLTESVHSALPDFVTLLFCLTISFVVAYTGFLPYDIR